MARESQERRTKEGTAGGERRVISFVLTSDVIEEDEEEEEEERAFAPLPIADEGVRSNEEEEV